MAKFFMKKVKNHEGEEVGEPKLHFTHETDKTQVFEGVATEEHKVAFAGVYAAFLKEQGAAVVVSEEPKAVEPKKKGKK